MVIQKERCLVLVVLWLVLWPSATPGQSPELNANVRLANDYIQQGQHDQAVWFMEDAVRLSEVEFGDDHPNTAFLLNGLGVVYENLGRYEEAESANQLALAIQERTLGADHPQVAISLNNLANLDKIKGDHSRAESRYQRAIRILEDIQGDESRKALAGFYSNLADLYEVQGHYSDAEPLYLRSLQINEEILGREHPEVGALLNYLGRFYETQGRQQDAEASYKRALKVREAVWGSKLIEAARVFKEEAKAVAESSNNLAVLYERNGQYAEAEPLYQRALAFAERSLGRDHPDLAIYLENYGHLLRNTGRNEEAKELKARAKAIRAKHAQDNPAE